MVGVEYEGVCFGVFVCKVDCLEMLDVVVYVMFVYCFDGFLCYWVVLCLGMDGEFDYGCVVGVVFVKW